jgi:DNA-binding response OmpR family regulator
MGQGNSNRKNILVVEDEPVIAKICARTLSTEGFQVESAVNGKAALDVLNQKEYDLCLIDIRTPMMNGIELYQHLEENYPGMTSRVIFTTGDVLSGNTKAFLEKTNRPYLPKPFTPDELRAIVRRVLGLN